MKQFLFACPLWGCVLECGGMKREKNLTQGREGAKTQIEMKRDA